MGKEKSGTKVCKHCKSEIAAGAKICPHCRKKQNGGALKWILIAILILIVAGAAVGSGDDKPSKVGEVNTKTDDDPKADDSGKEDATVKDDEEKETVFRKGEIAELNGVQVTLTDYKENTGSEYNKPTDGNVFLMAEFEIANNTEKELSISSALSFEAYADDYALNFSFSALMEKEGNQLDGTIAAGKKLKGWIGWEVPADYQNVEIHFTDNVWSSDKFVFVIEK